MTKSITQLYDAMAAGPNTTIRVLRHIGFLLIWSLSTTATAQTESMLPFKAIDPEIVDAYRNAYLDIVTGDDFDPSTGTVSFSVTDISIPGNFAIPVELRRAISKNNVEFGWTSVWTWQIPMIHFTVMEPYPGAPTGDITYGANFLPGTGCEGGPPTWTKWLTGPTNYVAKAIDYWSGKTLDIPGVTSEKFLHTTAGDLQTKSNFLVDSCLANDGFVVKSPDGTTYTFDEMRSIELPWSYNQTNPLRKYERYYLVSTIEDRFGNTVTYSYNAPDSNLSRIESSDGRVITIDYESFPAGGNTYYQPSAAHANGKTWTYNNVVVQNPQGYTYHMLGSVDLPDNTSWTYSGFERLDEEHSLYPIQRSNTDVNGQNNGGDCGVETINGNDQPFDVVVTAPTGLQTAYTIQSTYHGRSDVPHHQTVEPATYVFDTQDKYARNLSCTIHRSLRQKVITGDEVATQTWTYSYSENRGGYIDPEYSSRLGPALAPTFPPFPAPSNVAPSTTDFRTTTVTGPATKTVFYIDREFGSVTEGQVVAEDQLTADSSRILKRTEYSYVVGNQVGTHWFAGWTGDSFGINDYQTQYRNNKTQDLQILYGTTYSDKDQYVTDYSNFDSYGFSTNTAESNSFSTSQRYTESLVLHDSARWILGVPWRTRISPDNAVWTTVSETLYHSNTGGSGLADTNLYDGLYLPYEYRSYGTWQFRYPTYHLGSSDAGTLAKLEVNAFLRNSSGGQTSTYRYQEYKNYKRGIAQLVELPRRYNNAVEMTMSRTVDDDGRVTRITDLNGVHVDYGYDSMGRLIWVDKPGQWKDTFIDWTINPGTQIKRTAWTCDLNASKTGCTGKTLQHVAHFDALFRVIRTDDTDLLSGETRYQNFAYDDRHNVIFESYPSALASETDGVSTQFDALSRVLSQTTTGGGTTYTDYLTGNKVRYTDARSYVTDTTYLAYGAPDQSSQVLIEQPESVDTALQYNAFGDLVSITQIGPGKDGVGTVSQTEYRAYDARHRLCKITRADAGVTVFSNNLIGEVDWHAAGVTSSSNTNCSSTNNTASRLTYVYDNLGDVWTGNYTDTSTPDLTYTRDNNGQIKTLSAGSVVNTYDYEDIGLIKSETLAVDSKNLSLAYGYDPDGSLNRITYPDGDVLNYSSNAFGEAKRAWRSTRGSYDYANNALYHPNGTLASFDYGNGLQHSTSLNARRLPVTVQDFSGGLTALHKTYQYDNEANVKSITDGVNSNFSIVDINYDGLQRLIGTTGNAAIGDSLMRYDGLGNITRYETTNSVLDYTYNTTSNLLTSVAGTGSRSKSYGSFQYDSRGNVKDNSHRLFNYNMANQMVASGSNVYRYDGHNRRVKSVASAGTSYSFYSQSGRLLYRETQHGGINYIYLADRLIAKDGYIANNAGQQHAYPYGESAEGEIDDVGYTGHKFDADLDLIYAQARYYDPVIGRFMAVDPVGFTPSNPMSFNRYLYGNDNPFKFKDPDGNQSAPFATNYPTEQDMRRAGLSDAQIASARQAIDAAVELQAKGTAAIAMALSPVDETVLIVKAVQIGAQPFKAASATIRATRSVPNRSPDINPRDVAGKTPNQIDDFARDKGLNPKGPDPVAGKGSYTDPVTGQQRILIHPNPKNCVGPHCHVNNPAGQRLDIDGNVVPPESPAAHLPLGQ